jgi:hypothetical protein
MSGKGNLEMVSGVEKERVCAIHDVLWEHHDKDTEQVRDTVCRKIHDAHELAEKAVATCVPWRTFAIVIMIGIATIGGSYTLVWHSIQDLSKAMVLLSDKVIRIEAKIDKQ